MRLLIVVGLLTVTCALGGPSAAQEQWWKDHYNEDLFVGFQRTIFENATDKDAFVNLFVYADENALCYVRVKNPPAEPTLPGGSPPPGTVATVGGVHTMVRVQVQTKKAIVLQAVKGTASPLPPKPSCKWLIDSIE